LARAIQERRHDRRDQHGGTYSEHVAGEGQRQALPQEQAEDIALLRAEGHADPDFVRPFDSDVRHHAIVALVASIVPTRHATGLEPTTALRIE
jgi:hypothetical protein